MEVVGFESAKKRCHFKKALTQIVAEPMVSLFFKPTEVNSVPAKVKVWPCDLLLFVLRY